MSRGSERLGVVMAQLEDGVKALTDEKDRQTERRFASGAPFTNWARIGQCRPATHHRPRSEAEVVEVVQAVTAAGAHARVVGAGASPNAMCFTQEHMIHMGTHMHNIVEVDTKQRRITVEGGASLRHIFGELDRAGLMIPCVPSFLDTTIGGCIGTGTHGSGLNVRSLAAYVVGLRVVTGTGEVRVVDKATTPAEWAHWACHLGVLGVVTQVTLQAERKALWRRISAPIACAAIKPLILQRAVTNDYYRFWWTPHTDMCYEATIRPVAGPDDEHSDTRSVAPFKGVSSVPGRQIAAEVPTHVLGGTDLDRDRVVAISRALRDPHAAHSLWEREHGQQQTIDRLAHRLLPGDGTAPKVAIQHGVLERLLHAATFTPHLQPSINQAYQKAYLNSTDEQYGTAAETMSFDCLFRQHTAEWAVDAARTVEAFEAVQGIVKQHGLRVHFPVEFRFVEADDITMSPAAGRKTCYIGIVMFRPFGREAPDTQRFLKLFSEAMQALGGRPHWAKYYNLHRADLVAMYGAERVDGFECYRQACDPKGIFVNDWYRSLTQ